MQKGTIVISGGQLSGTGTIAAVDTTKTFVIGTGSFPGSGSPDAHFSVRLTNSTLVTALRGSTGTGGTVAFSVAEFSSGVSVTHGLGTITSGGTVGTSTIPTVGTLSRAILIYYHRNTANTTYGADDMSSGHMASVTSVAARNQLSSTAAFYDYQVINHDAVTVQRGTLIVPAATASANVTVSNFDVSKSWLLYSCNTTAGTAADIGQKGIVGSITNSGTLNFARFRTGTDMGCFWQLATFADNTRVQHGTLGFTVARTVGTLALSPSIMNNQSLAIGGWLNTCGGCNNGATGTGQPVFQCFRYDLTSTQLLATRQTAGSLASAPYSIITFPKRKITLQE